MNRWTIERSGDPRRSVPGGNYRAPVVGILVLLAGWLVLAEWQALPALAEQVLRLAR